MQVNFEHYIFEIPGHNKLSYSLFYMDKYISTQIQYKMVHEFFFWQIQDRTFETLFYNTERRRRKYARQPVGW